MNAEASLGGMRGALLSMVFIAICLCCAASLLVAGSTAPVHAQQGAHADSKATPKRTGYAGDDACLACHKQESSTYRQSSHHLASQLPDKSSILGSFSAGKNILMIANPSNTDEDPRLFFEMDAKDGSYYQTAIAERAGKRLTHQERFDLVIGSGTRGQTYLYWRGNELFELPVSYWKDGGQWINSPGYKDGTANFDRHVDPRCLECHSTFIQPLASDPQTNLYNKASLLPGISCESCHGPGSSHIAAEQSKPQATQGNHSQSGKLPARSPVDQCALCHNGTERAEIAPAFSYLPGQPLDKYLGANPADISDQPDVHGNQVGLLKKSRCYLSSSSMSCSTCHNVHAPERAAASYSDRCLGCHQWQACGRARSSRRRNQAGLHQLPHAVAADWRHCVHHRRTHLRTSIRTHWIKVYPEVAAQVDLR
jgi:hypothetical protein